jgi:ubiquinone/menaquinone biosynthesis C-methylase UbiE
MEKHNAKHEDYLDLACGTGNVAVRMAREFKNTYAVDLSEDMLRESYDKFKKNRIKGKIVCQDMTDLSLNHKFDVISCVLDSTNYIIEDEDLEKYFKGVYNHLKDDGLFFFDINSHYKLTNILGNNIYIYNEEKVFYSWENVLEGDIVSMFLTFFVKNGELYEKFEEEHLERAYKEKFVEDMLEKCEFRVIDKFNGYNDEDVTDCSERILYVVGKKMEV